MSNKFSTPKKIKAPYLCETRPPFPPPELPPFGPILLAYEYWLDDGEGRRIANAGRLVLQPTTETEWVYDPGPDAPGIPLAIMTYNSAEKTAQLSFEILIEDGWGIEYESAAIADPPKPPWAWDADLEAGYSPSWPQTYAHGSLMLL